jgi:two-component system, LytTR family, response regulator
VQRTIRTLIVDDEPIARQVLREQLEVFPEVEIAGEAENGPEALRKIAEIQPDLVFLDLQMPVMGGFELVQKLAGPAPVIVIVTAYNEHAIRAFEAGAIDYLLKPVSEQRLKKAIDRVRGVAGAGRNPSRTRKVVGRSGGEFVLLELDEVLAFQAEGELVWIVTASQRLLATQTLRSIEERLGKDQFQRVHRNAIINVNHVRKLSATTSQRWLITLSNAMQLVASKRQAHNIRKMLKW